MRALLAAIVLMALSTGSFAGQVVYANFDDLESYTYVDYHYPGAFIDGEVVSGGSLAHSAPNEVNLKEGEGAILFPRGVVWVSLWTKNALAVVACDASLHVLGRVDYSNPYSTWKQATFQFGEPIGSVWCAFELYSSPYVDDLSYEIVPEPSAFCSLAGLLGALGLMWRRRRG